MANAPFPDKGSIGTFFSPDPSEPDSTNNPHLKLIQTMFAHNFKSGAYGSDWSSISLPSSPVEGILVVRYNTNTSSKRIYAYDSNDGWQFTTVQTAAGVSTNLGDLNDVTITGTPANNSIISYY